MFDLTKFWPLGLSKRNWPWFCLAVILGVAILSQVDVWASRGAIGWSDASRAPFFWITDYGLSDWVLIPSLIILIVALPLAYWLRGLVQQATREIVMLAAFLFTGVAVPGLIANLIKRLIGRSRPVEFDSLGAFSFQSIFNEWNFQSFPSGHTTTAMAMALVFGFIWPRAFPLLFLIGLAVGFSRVVVGMHYPTDVLGGFVVGLIGAYLVRNVFASKGWMFTIQPDGHVRPRGFPAIRELIQRARV